MAFPIAFPVRMAFYSQPDISYGSSRLCKVVAVPMRFSRKREIGKSSCNATSLTRLGLARHFLSRRGSITRLFMTHELTTILDENGLCASTANNLFDSTARHASAVRARLQAHGLNDFLI